MAKRKRSGGSWLLVAAILVWIAVGLAYYYAFHRPFTPQFALNMLAAFRDLAVTATLFAVAGAVGTRLLRELRGPTLARFALRSAAGLGALGLSYLLIGSTLGTSIWVAWAVLIALGVSLRAELRIWWSDAGELRRLLGKSGVLGKTIAALCAVIFAAALVVALAPPLAFDSLVYHLALPKLYLQQGQVSYVPEVTHWGFPQLAHMLITWQGALGAAHGALVAWGMGLLATLGILGHVSDRLGPRRAWVAIAALLCGSSLATALASAYVDWPAILMGWATLFVLDLWLQKREPRWAMWAGVFCGLAFGAKYTAGLLAPLGAVAIFWASRDWRAVARFLGSALLLALPWLLRNALATGNLFYPLLLPGGEMDAVRLGYYTGFAAQGNVWDAALLPLRATWLGIEGGRIGAAPGYETSLGPLLLLLGALAFLPAVESKQAGKTRWLAAVIAIGGLLFWAIAGRLTGHLIRSHLYFFLFPAFAILAAFGFAAAERIRAGKLRVGRIVAAVVCLALGLNAVQSLTTLVSSGALQLVAGVQSSAQYRQQNLGLYATVMDSLPAETSGGRTMLLWETRGYDCLPLCDPDEVIDRWPHDLAIFGSADAVFDAWRSRGFEYVLYYKLGAQFVHADPTHFHSFDINELETALGSLNLARDYNGDYLLYALGQ